MVKNSLNYINFNKISWSDPRFSDHFSDYFIR